MRAALSSSSGGRKMKKKMLEGLMPNQMELALPMWPKLKWKANSSNAAPKAAKQTQPSDEPTLRN